MNELIKTTVHNGSCIVNARELHEFLESKQEFANWIKGRIEKYGFIENEDYISFDKIIKRETGSTIRKEYGLTIDTAKELSMVENSDKGRQARCYFIEMEIYTKSKFVHHHSIKELAQMVIDQEDRMESERQGVASEWPEIIFDNFNSIKPTSLINTIKP